MSDDRTHSSHGLMASLTPGERSQVFLKLIERRDAEIGWVKDLDQRLAYYPLLGFAVLAIATLGSGRGSEVAKVSRELDAAIVVVVLVSIAMLIRNHVRHRRLLIARQELLCVLTGDCHWAGDFAFWAGRGIYAAMLVVGGYIATSFLHTLAR